MVRRALASIALALACLLALAGAAQGHALLESSTPARGAQLTQAPPEVSFTFSEAVESSLGAVQVFNTEGEQVQSSDLERSADANTVGAKLPADLPDGLYTATYRVISADSHPISGGITFTLGKPGKDDSRFVSDKTISELLASTQAGEVTKIGFWFDRWIGYLALAVAIGALAWMLFAWSPSARSAAGERSVSRRFRTLVLVAAGLGVAASLAAVIFQGALAAGTSFWGAFGSGIPGEVADTRFGSMMLVRSAAWVLLAVGVVLAGRVFKPRSPGVILAMVGAVVLALSPALAGHASTRDPAWLLVPTDAFHVAAMAIWSGGLAAMLILLPAATRSLGSGTERTRLLCDVTLRFSGSALAAVTVIAVTGAVLGIVEVGSVPALLDTAFGRAVTIKIVIFAALIVLAAVNRNRVVPALVERRESQRDPGQPGFRLRRLLRAEVLLVTVVLGVSAALVSYPPPDSIQAGPVSGSTQSGPDRIDYTVDPGQVGSNEVHVYVFNDDTGAPVPVISMEIDFSKPDSGIAPIEAPAQKAGPGHFVVTSAMLGVKGTWLAKTSIRVSTFTERTASFEVEIK